MPNYLSTLTTSWIVIIILFGAVIVLSLIIQLIKQKQIE